MTVKTEDQMADYDMIVEELEAAGCFDPPPAPHPGPPPVVCYRNAAGQRWDGTGEMDARLAARAVNAGQSKEFYRIG
ncbi:H-NS histone family protein [Cupriavidus sp. AcVe19-6a]|uniref:H-NS histone family protein n=1 Tax=Cupriavidus sp. AcVe19-6a TaxID=2821358 RepID=UPI001AE741A3|nr:H-NS histone family protein [Cupriavidus sp. AcVe19-6a]MBP0640064.1 H-NS histone family protein [Cupriavidus sp. AcVe19-6a]